MRLTTNAFLPASRRRLLLEPEADQQIRAEPDAFPADEHHQEVAAEHEHQHERREQVQVREVAGERRRSVLHVADRVDVDQQADAGHDQHHHRRQGIEHGTRAAWKLPDSIQVKHASALLSGDPGQLPHAPTRQRRSTPASRPQRRSSASAPEQRVDDGSRAGIAADDRPRTCPASGPKHVGPGRRTGANQTSDRHHFRRCFVWIQRLAMPEDRDDRRAGRPPPPPRRRS